MSRHHPVGGGGFFNQLKGYIEDGIVLFGLVVAAAAFVKVAEAAVTTFLRCVTARRAGDSSGPLSWSGVVLLVAVIWLLGKSANIIL
ncbi:TIGR03745 family integrating conjugative element membrane protein [Escherichia coli]|nr:TIGR03745 family integrating conjugative element membrane protein [Escherichia coli]